MLVAAALCPAAPLLVPELYGQHAPFPQLRRAVADAVAALRAARADVVVVGAAPATAEWPADTPVDFGPWRGLATTSAPALPLPLAVGATVLGGPARLQGVDPAAEPDACAALGRALVAGPGRVALLVVGGGSVRPSRDDDPRAAAFDAAARGAVAAGDLAALRHLDPGLATALQADGRAPWQVLAGAAGDRPVTARVTYADAPLGVGYLVADLTP